MRIGLIAPPWVPVPPVRYGGTEEVVDDLARGLTRRGHDVRLFTVGESTCPVPRRWYFDAAVEPLGMTVPEAAHVLSAYRTFADGEVDLIHDHTVLGPLVAGRPADVPPIVATNHGPFTPEARLIYREITSSADLVAISRSQRATAPEIPVAAVIHHGIDLDRHPFGDGDGGYLMFVGRMSADKGVHRAIRVARRAGRRLVVVSKMRDAPEVAYYEQAVRPLLGDDIDLYSDLAGPERIALLRSATAVLNPICWPEPFGLVMTEALACGTPVLAFPNGAAPEIIDHGVTGYLCTDEADMVDAIGRVDALDRHACREAAELRFGMDRMAADHERLYERVLDRGRGGPGSRRLVVSGQRSPAEPSTGSGTWASGATGKQSATL